MPDDPAVADPVTPAGPGLLRRCANNLDPSQPLFMPAHAVRGILALVIVVGTTALLWRPDHWAPPELLVLVSAVTAFYFTNPEGNTQMRAFLALFVVGSTIVFFYLQRWAPDVLITNATTVVVLYFGQRSIAKANGEKP